MAEPPRTVLLLAGRLGTHADSGPVCATLDRLGRLGIDAQVLCISGEDGAPRDDRVVECPGLGCRWRQALAVRRLRLGESLARPELIHVLQTAVGPAGLAIAEHWRIPYVQTVDEFLGPRGRIRLSRRWCRKLVAVSRELADDLRSGLGVPSSFLTVIVPGIPSAGDDAGVAAREAQVPVIGTAGPLVAASGFATFLAAARRVIDAGVDAEFVIAGQGEDEVDLRRRAARLRIADRVTFAGMPVVGLRFWSVLDVFCQTSLAPTAGRTLATAMASGVPSIASDIEGLRTLVAHEETGLRVPPNDSSALAETILALLNDPGRARGLGLRGRALIRREFDPDAEAEALAGLYRAVLGGGARQSQTVLTG